VKPSPALSQVSIRRVNGVVVENSPDVLAVEEPLEIRLGFPDKTHRAISITMRTPGDDAELAAGFLFTEGIVTSPDQIKQIRHCGKKDAEATNTIRVDLDDGVDIDFKRLERNFYTTSSCGVCGKSSIEALHTGAKKLSDPNGPQVAAQIIHSLPERLRAEQRTFDQTGGLHASALFDSSGALEIVREDVGRHNALDKVIGAKFLNSEVPVLDKILVVSGRASFELVQKALMAGIAIIVAVGAPSSLAFELATEFGMTLVGFARDASFNVYSGSARII
jgi:FdhD protein